MSFGWISCWSWLMYRHIPEWVNRQFGYVYGIPRAPIVAAPLTFHCRYVDEIFVEYFDRLVLEDIRSVPSPHPWNTAFDYIELFFTVSHSYMTPNAEGEPPMQTHEEILEEEQAMTYIVIDVLPTCQCIVPIGWVGIKRGKFQEDNFGRANIETMIAEARNALQYTRKRRNRLEGSDIPNSWLFLYILIICIFIYILWTWFVFWLKIWYFNWII